MMIVVLVGENDCCKMCGTICCPMTKANCDIEFGGTVSNRVENIADTLQASDHTT